MFDVIDMAWQSSPGVTIWFTFVILLDRTFQIDFLESFNFNIDNINLTTWNVPFCQ